MATNPINVPPKKPSGGGGLLGKVIGGAAGLIGGSFVGQPMAGMALGSTAGEVVGSVASPGSAGKQIGGPTQLDTAMKHDPELQMGFLSQAQRDLAVRPDFSADQAKEAFNYLEDAKAKLAERLKLGS